MSTKLKKPYSKRSDSEKIESNWRKTLGLFKREEYSVSIIRAATSLELAANLVIRKELILRKKLPNQFVKDLLFWTNGLKGKMKIVALFICRNKKDYERFSGNLEKANYVNTERNKIAHRGEFKKEKTARKIIKQTRKVIMDMTQYCNSTLRLEDL